MNTYLKYVTGSKVVLSIVSLLMIIGLVGGAVAISTGIAQAGSNGQMVRAAFACSNPAKITWIKISGRNQDNNYAVWEKRPNSTGVQTHGWWWKGNVLIEWRTNRDSYLHSTVKYVPKSYERDYVGVLLDKWGC